MTAPHRRGACPGLSAPMPTGDGLLVRFMPAEDIALEAFVALCAAARAHGNGTVEVTARGSLQIRGLTPKALSGVTHSIQSLVKANQMQVQLLLALRNNGARTVPYDPAKFRLRLVRPGGKATTFESVSTSVRAGELTARSEMETTIGFVVPRFSPKGTRLSFEFLEASGPPRAVDLGPVRPGGSLAAVQAALNAGHVH